MSHLSSGSRCPILERVQAASASASNDATALELGRINHDFNLVKFEPPEEYQALGDFLSKERRSDAEEGSAHITARTLGALFEGIHPATPNLLKAYGKRMCHVTRIAHATFTASRESGDFGSLHWTDATFLWAAATSGPSALQVWLLNCMIARTISQGAISIWKKLIKTRQKEIYERDELLNYCTIAVMKQWTPSRSQLAEWDASARAWLRVADMIQRRQRQQFLSALSYAEANRLLKLSRNQYDRVVDGWKVNTTVLKNLLAGTVQNHHNEDLRFLDAFHIYPNILIGPRTPSFRNVKFNDELVPSRGILMLSPPSVATRRTYILARSAATWASGLRITQVLTRRRNQTTGVHLSLQGQTSVEAESLPTTTGTFSTHSSGLSGEIEEQLPNSALVVDCFLPSTTPSDPLNLVQDSGNAPNQTSNIVRNGSPHSRSESRIHLPYKKVSARQTCARYIRLVGAITTLLSSLTTALVLIYAVGHSISDAFTAAAWVFPVGAVFLYVIKSCFGGEVEERISPFS